MSGELLSVKQTSQILFGKSDDWSMKKTRDFMRLRCIDTVKIGKRDFVKKSELFEYMGTTDETIVPFQRS
tara:strand:+ start:99 stop:308 length:210 start_codon:yes stop_codon:yes gene_type:complete